MTNEQAIYVLKNAAWLGTDHSRARTEEAVEMAIQALSQEPICDRDCEHCTWTECPIEPCDDTVSRQAAIEAVSKGCQEWRGIYGRCEELINALPPVTQKPETVTEFADRCRECGARYGKLLEQRSGKWIPVSERLPEAFRYVNCTCHSLIDDREDWVVETFYLPQSPDSPYSDWGNIPMLNMGNCEVVAWMYRDIPTPYEPQESEDKR